MGFFDSLEKKFDELKKDVGFGDNSKPQQGHPGGGYPGAPPQQYYPPPQGQYPPPQQQQWGQPPPMQHQQSWGPPPPQHQQSWGPPQHQQSWAPPPPQQHQSGPPQGSPTSPPPNSPQPQQQQQQPPPPPSDSAPQQPKSGNPTDYWQPTLHASRRVGEDWDQKIGNGDNGWGNNELQHYTDSPQNSFYTPNYKLVLRAISNPSDSNPATRYTSARLVSRQRLDRPRGCLTAVISNPSAPGIWPAFWLLPGEPFQWPYEGEVDIGESWNGEATNHTCLHWGHFSPEDNDKHRVMDTHIGDLGRRPVKYEFAWDQDESSGGGRYLWWIDGRPVMKWHIPEGFRPMREWTVLLNIAMGGNVCQGKTPPQGQFEMVVHEMRMSGECDGGWQRFEGSWWQAPEGNRM